VLAIELRVGESVKIGDATVTLIDKSGKVARLSIEAAKTVPIQRIQSTSMAQIVKSGIGAMPG
jgi:sRNA-binding carbon storage regulator CsrA